MIEILKFLTLKFDEAPTSYGVLHLIFIALVIASTIVLCKYFKDVTDKTFRKILLGMWITVTVLEIYKQFTFSYSIENDVITWDYQWYAFPFQFCSSQLYILPFIVFLKDGKVRDGCMSFLQFWSTFAGLAVFAYPNDIFIPQIGINFQTLIHHGLQVVIGVYLMVYNRKKIDIKFYLRGVIVFVIMTAVAMVINLVAPFITSETVNMFYISPYFDCTLPVLSMIYPLVPYVVFLLLYVLGFSFVGYLVYLINKLVTKLYKNA